MPKMGLPRIHREIIHYSEFLDEEDELEKVGDPDIPINSESEGDEPILLYKSVRIMIN